jgi:thiol:disulfide interchange protein DsbD
MSVILKKFISILILFFALNRANAQDSLKLQWEVNSKKIGEGIYELKFSTPGNSGWQLYDPNISISDVPASELSFGDSSITVEKPIVVNG